MLRMTASATWYERNVSPRVTKPRTLVVVHERAVQAVGVDQARSQRNNNVYAHCAPLQQCKQAASVPGVLPGSCSVVCVIGALLNISV